MGKYLANEQNMAGLVTDHAVVISVQPDSDSTRTPIVFSVLTGYPQLMATR